MGRVEAVLQLAQWSIDWDSGTIDLHKPGRARTKKRRALVPMVPTLRTALARHKGASPVSWQGRSIASVRTTFRKAIERAGLSGSGVCQYTLRHTIISEAKKR